MSLCNIAGCVGRDQAAQVMILGLEYGFLLGVFVVGMLVIGYIIHKKIAKHWDEWEENFYRMLVKWHGKKSRGKR
jgi:hypothetical protein